MFAHPRLFTAPPTLGPLRAGLERIELAPGSWIDLRRGWLTGDDQLFAHLESTTRWHAGQRRMYDRIVAVPRLTASLPADGAGHPVLAHAVRALTRWYQRPVDRVSLALYRSGADSVAFHGDRLGAAASDAIVAILSLQGPRRLLVRPRKGGASRGWHLGFGDLLVMGGRTQVDFEHGVPKVARAEPRMSVMFRSSGVVPRPEAPR